MTPRQKLKDRFFNAIFRRVKMKLGPFEFNGPALLIYPIELLLIMLVITIIIIAVKRPDIILNLIEAAAQ